MNDKLSDMGNALKCMQHHIVIKHYCKLGGSSYLNTDFVYMDYMYTFQEMDIQMREQTHDLRLCGGGEWFWVDL